jgi:hypothetical protein
LFLVSSPGANPVGPQLPATQVPLAKESSLLQSVATLEPVPAIAVRKPTAVRLAAAEDLDVKRSRAPWMFLMGVAVMAAVVAFVKLGTRTSSGEQSAAIPPEVPTARMAPPVEKEAEPAAKTAVEATPAVVRPEAVASATPEKKPSPEKPFPAPAVNADPVPASEGVAASKPDDTLARLQRALDRVEKLPEADQKRILPDLKDWRKVERRMAAGKPGADVNRKVLASLEKQLDALGH